jgi:ankyrin repeat protein
MTTRSQFKLQMNTLLLDSIINGDLEKVQFSIQNGADINFKTEENETVLDLATDSTNSPNYTIIKFLVENGANISRFNLEDSFNMDDRIFPLFIKNQQDLDLTFILDTFTHYQPASISLIRIYQIVKSLVQYGAVVSDGALQRAFKKFDYNTVMFLLNNKKGGINKDVGYYTENLELFQLLVSLGVNLNAENQYMFKGALSNLNFNLLNYLIKNTGTNVNGDQGGEEEFYIRFILENIEDVMSDNVKKSLDVLFDNGYIFKENDHSLSNAAYIGDLNLFQYILSKGAPVTDILELFIDSARGGNLYIFKYFENLLLPDVVSINLALENSSTVDVTEYIANKYMNRISSLSIYKSFTKALLESNLGIVKFLLENLIKDLEKFKNENFSNIDEDDDDDDDDVSENLEIAIRIAKQTNYEILKLMLKHSAKYTDRSLSLAVQDDDLYIVQLLFFYYPNEIDLSWEYNNYLLTSIQEGNKELFKFLISKYPFQEKRKMLNFAWNTLTKNTDKWYNYKFKNKINPVKEYLKDLVNTNQSGLKNIIPYEVLLETQKYLG